MNTGLLCFFCTLQNKEIGAGGMAQVVGHLPSKCEALNSNSSAMKKKRNKEIGYYNHLIDQFLKT
jgi:hypothetical protein